MRYLFFDVFSNNYLCVAYAQTNWRERETVWLNQPWATPVALLSFVFDLVGGGEMVRLNITITCIAEITPPNHLYALSLNLSIPKQCFPKIISRSYFLKNEQLR